MGIVIHEHEFEEFLLELKLVTNNQTLTPKLSELRGMLEEHLNNVPVKRGLEMKLKEYGE